VLDRPEIDLCLKDPGFPVDVVVIADLRTLTQVWMGDVPLAEALRAGSIRLDGPPSSVRAFPAWLRLSSFAGVERAGTAAALRRPGRPVGVRPVVRKEGDMSDLNDLPIEQPLRRLLGA
jgi:hypothetical protein